MPTATEVTHGLSLGLPSSTRMAIERSAERPDVNRFYLTPVVIAASSWWVDLPVDVETTPADLASSVAEDICAAYPQRLPTDECGNFGLADRSGAAARVIVHFDWDTDGGRLVRSHVVVFVGDVGEVAVLHLTVPRRLATEASTIVDQLIDSARFEPKPIADDANPQPIPAAIVALSQGAITS